MTQTTRVEVDLDRVRRAVRQRTIVAVLCLLVGLTLLSVGTSMLWSLEAGLAILGGALTVIGVLLGMTT